MKICKNCGAVLDDQTTLCIFCNFETGQLPIVNENEIEVIECTEHSFYKNEEDFGEDFLGKKSTDGATKAKVAIVFISIIVIAFIAVLASLGSSFEISVLILFLAMLVVALLFDFGTISYVIYTQKRPKYLVTINDVAIIFPEQNIEIKFEDIDSIFLRTNIFRAHLSSVGYMIIKTKSGAEYEEGPIEYVEETVNKLNRIFRKKMEKKQSNNL